MKSYRRIKSITKACEILQFLSEQRGAVSGKEIARTHNMPFSTAMCHIKTLEDAGFVKKEGEGFTLGLRLAVYWARTKSLLENQRTEIDQCLKALETGV